MKNWLLCSIVVLSLTAAFLITGFSLGEGSFKESSDGLPEEGEYDYVSFGDFDNDNDPDMVFCAGGYSSVTVHGLYAYKGDGKGGWTDSSSGLPTDGNYGCVILADVDKDGNEDILAGHDHWSGSSAEGMVIFKGDGKGGWSEGTSPYTEKYIAQIVVEDINGDGNPDIAASTQKEGVKVWLGDGSGSKWTESSENLASSGEFCGIALGDIDGDGNLDIAATDYKGEGISLFKGDGKGGWTDKTDSSPLSRNNNFGIAIVDFNDDGDMDIICNSQRKGVQAYAGDGSWGFTESSIGLPVSGEYGELAVTDFNDDGNLDIVTATSGGGLHLYLGNNGALTYSWSEATDIGLPSGDTYYGCALSDFDKDGDVDIAGSTWGNGITAWKNEGYSGEMPADDDTTDDDTTDDDTTDDDVVTDDDTTDDDTTDDDTTYDDTTDDDTTDDDITDDDIVEPDDDDDDDDDEAPGFTAVMVILGILGILAFSVRKRY